MNTVHSAAHVSGAVLQVQFPWKKGKITKSAESILNGQKRSVLPGMAAENARCRFRV